MAVSPRSVEQKNANVRGYVEGYYAKLLSWQQRSNLVKHLASVQLNTYCYAPKEDPQHRLYWRKAYSLNWLKSFEQFCTFSSNLNVSVIAGIAPGLDFDHQNSDADFKCLHRKATELLRHGANDILILWDDIDDDFATDQDGVSEGVAHARVVNKLGDAIGKPLWTVPRVYAAEIENKNNYLQDFFAELQPRHTVLLCGNAIVTREVRTTDLLKLSYSQNDLKHRTVLWDNFYANDYCPRQLFIGPWTGREEICDYLLNPTGMPCTDQVLVEIASSTHTSSNRHSDWIQVLERHGVPDAFQAIAPYFLKPVFGDEPIPESQSDIDCIERTAMVEQAIETCLWKWKSPLAREWYPFIMNLKHDLALMKRTLPRDRVLKTQPAGLARRLLS